MSVVIACDAHKMSVTIAVLDQRRAVLHQQTFPTNRAGRRDLVSVGRRWPTRRWAVEGSVEWSRQSSHRDRPGSRSSAAVWRDRAATASSEAARPTGAAAAMNGRTVVVMQAGPG